MTKRESIFSKLDYRLRIVDGEDRTYVVRSWGRVQYLSSSETPLALSNLVHEDAAETRFKLEDAADGAGAAKVLREVLADLWVKNAKCPSVEVL